MNTSPYEITHLKLNEIFVYGSNRAGINGAGAAKQAIKWGAKYGFGEGLIGHVYALPTKDAHIRTLPLDDIWVHVKRFIDFAHTRPDLKFLVTAVGCGLASYNPSEIAPLFFHPLNKPVPDNVYLPELFVDWYLTHEKEIQNETS